MTDKTDGYAKVLLTYDIIPETQEAYYQFMMGELVPTVRPAPTAAPRPVDHGQKPVIRDG